MIEKEDDAVINDPNFVNELLKSVGVDQESEEIKVVKILSLITNCRKPLRNYKRKRIKIKAKNDLINS